MNIPERARTVELPVCPRCGQVGKTAGGGVLGKTLFKCTGGHGKHHKQTQMVKVTYHAEDPDEMTKEEK